MIKRSLENTIQSKLYQGKAIILMGPGKYRLMNLSGALRPKPNRQNHF
jgi:hypothetical protein